MMLKAWKGEGGGGSQQTEMGPETSISQLNKDNIGKNLEYCNRRAWEKNGIFSCHFYQHILDSICFECINELDPTPPPSFLVKLIFHFDSHNQNAVLLTHSPLLSSEEFQEQQLPSLSASDGSDL